MATIIIGMHANHGHLMPTYKLASRLIDKGHRIIYLMSSDRLQPNIERNGFEFRYLDLYGPQWKLPPTSGKFIQDLQYSKKRTQKIFKELLPGGILEQELNKLQPDLVIWDTSDPIFALAIKGLCFPIVLFSSALDHSEAPGIPPLNSWLLPGEGAYTQLKIKASWWKHHAYYRTLNVLYSWLGIGQQQSLRRMCKVFGLRRQDWVIGKRGFLPGIVLPELVACPQVFDFERPVPDRMEYIGPCIYEDSHWGTIDFSKIPLDKPLIYCAFGSMTNAFKGYAEFLKRLFAAFAQRPQYTFLLASGEYIDIEKLGKIPDNVYFEKVVPQLKVLAKADLFITHAGLNSTKEGIYQGVPMIAIPFANDGIGNAARIAFHGIGERANYREVTEVEIITLIDRILKEPGYKNKVKKMQKAFREAEHAALGSNG